MKKEGRPRAIGRTVNGAWTTVKSATQHNAHISKQDGKEIATKIADGGDRCATRRQATA
ncbi:hypothetical protein VB151_18585 [Xanthomonas fragariae]|uniref:hypothetical protein n=1 Tax=Xanthomonas fragariae TaxID=48664 RepID=UPI0003A9F9D8|nr:hypothetical protein [Xanthomonas fragariae]MDM7556250.1 hypothetical protein [Xanthomonas fragariae]MEA5175510.1 hypothetical protein [Xanthomonas fragariae]MEA5200092.1 hypothetical protein [Xanthomonas fragariae]MEA5220814.1 hypothetical protein [Xanthomonas fragariae]